MLSEAKHLALARSFWEAKQLALDRVSRSRVSVMRQFYVYIMTDRSRTLYVGVTNNLERGASASIS